MKEARAARRRLGAAGAPLAALLVVFGAIPAAAVEVPVGSTGLWTLEGEWETRFVLPADDESPRENPRSVLRLTTGLELTRDWRIESRWILQAGGSPVDADGAGLLDNRHAFQDRSPTAEMDTLYLEGFFNRSDLRVGLQKFAWGKLDGEQPTDLLNPERFHDVFLDEEVDRKIGVMAVAANAYLPRDLRLELAWLPLAASFRFPDIDERWYPPLARVPEETTTMGVRVRNEGSVANGFVPAMTLRNGSIGARLSGFLEGIDWSFVVFDGWDRGPAFEADATGFASLDPTSLELIDARSEVVIFPVYDRIRAVGFDAATTVLGGTVRAEAVWVDGRLFPKTVRGVIAEQEFGAETLIGVLTPGENEVDVDLAPVNVERDAIEWGFGGDVLISDLFFLAQWNQTIVLDNDEDLLISDYESRLVGNVRRTFFRERLELEAIGVYGIQGVYGLGILQATARVNDYMDVRVGGLWIGGHEESLVGQYRRNDQGFVRLRILF